MSVATLCDNCHQPLADATQAAIHDRDHDAYRPCPAQAMSGPCWCENLCWALGDECPHEVDA